MSLVLRPDLGAGLTFIGEHPAPQNLPNAWTGQLLHFKLSLLIHKIPPQQNHQVIPVQAEEHFLTVLRVTNHSGEENFCWCCELNWVAITAMVLGEFSCCSKVEESVCFAEEVKFETATWEKSKVILETM